MMPNAVINSKEIRAIHIMVRSDAFFVNSPPNRLRAIADEAISKYESTELMEATKIPERISPAMIGGKKSVANSMNMVSD